MWLALFDSSSFIRKRFEQLNNNVLMSNQCLFMYYNVFTGGFTLILDQHKDGESSVSIKWPLITNQSSDGYNGLHSTQR